MIEQALAYIKDHKDEALDRLKAYLSIASVSADPAYDTGIREAADWTRDQLAKCGLSAEVMPTNGHPVVLGRTPDDRWQKDRLTVLFYGHYDVQPADPAEKWITGAFEPTVRDGALYARGASDDKGQVACFVEALRAWYETGHGPGVNVIVLIEGEEEVGSMNLPAFLEEHKDKLACDIAVVSDTQMWTDDTMAITYGLRGLVYFDIQLQGPSRDLHSGMYGGTLANPANVLARILGDLFDENHRVTIPGFYDDVVPLGDDEIEQWQGLNFDEKKFLGEIGMPKGSGEAGYECLERRWARPSCDINGLYGGYGGEGAKTIIPSYAGAKVSFRLAPNQDPPTVAEAFETWLLNKDTRGLTWKIKRHGLAYPVLVDRHSSHMQAAKQACKLASGKDAVLVREGATIPVVADFQRTLGVGTLLIGFGLRNDCIHAPNEKFDLKCFELGVRTHVHLLDELGKIRQ